jgi:nanoRNase/pAp phosphatase (c-di-AMP/oligoRNAs hydrolase)
VSKQFGGGGHKNAAGCTVVGAVDTLQRIFVEKMTQAIDAQVAEAAVVPRASA